MKSKELKEQATQFRKRDPDDPERCYQPRIDNIDEHLIYQLELKNRNDQTRTMFGNHFANSSTDGLSLLVGGQLQIWRELQIAPSGWHEGNTTQGRRKGRKGQG